MRKSFLFLMFILIAVWVKAQSPHTLSLDRNAYRACDTIVKQQVVFKDPGSKGRQLSWDFSMLQPINEEYKLCYSMPDKKQTNRLCGLEHNTRYYFNQQKDSLWATGFENYTTFMQYTKPELRLRFPFQYGDTLFSSFEGVGEYCHRIPLHVKGYTRVEADAEGDLILPNSETIKKTTRVRTLRHYTETGKDSIEMELDTYSWYATGIRYPVFESIKTTVKKNKGTTQTASTPQEEGTGSEVTVFSTSFYYPPELQTSQVETAPITVDSTAIIEGAANVFTEVRLMPNPVVDNLTINYKLTRDARIWFTLHNNIGIPMATTAPQNLTQGMQCTTIPMASMITGTYSLYVHVDDMVIRLNVVKK